MIRHLAAAADSSEGSASVWVLTCVLVLAVATAVSVAVGAAVDLRHRAAVAADAAALAGAVDGGLVDTACTAASRAAADNGARLADCRVSDAVVTVRTLVAPPGWLVWLGAATARARAGPAPLLRAAEPTSTEISP